MSSLVSVITPCYEHEQYLEDYFESLLAQSYRNIELVFCDDDSKDRSWAVARGYRQKLKDRFIRVVMVRNERNIGLIATLERLRTEVQGEILCILESDDHLYPTKVEENLSYLRQHPEVGLVHSDADFFYMETGRRRRAHWASKGGRVPQGDAFETLLHENCILTCTVACRTSLVAAHVDLGLYRERGYQAADYPMFLDLARQTRFGYIDRPLAVYRIVRDSISHPGSEVERYRWLFDYQRVKQDYIREHGCSAEIKERADAQFHASELDLGWVSGSAELFARGSTWLMQHRPDRVGRWTRRVRSAAVRNPVLWRAVRGLERILRSTSTVRRRVGRHAQPHAKEVR